MRVRENKYPKPVWKWLGGIGRRRRRRRRRRGGFQIQEAIGLRGRSRVRWNAKSKCELQLIALFCLLCPAFERRRRTFFVFFIFVVLHNHHRALRFAFTLTTAVHFLSQLAQTTFLFRKLNSQLSSFNLTTCSPPFWSCFSSSQWSLTQTHFFHLIVNWLSNVTSVKSWCILFSSYEKNNPMVHVKCFSYKNKKQNLSSPSLLLFWWI